MTQVAYPALAGSLRERVTFQRRALDKNGDRLGPWTDEFSAQARVVSRMTPRTHEAVLQGRITGLGPVEITVRISSLTAPLDTDWRAVWRGRPYEVTALSPDELNVTLSILAESINADNSAP